MRTDPIFQSPGSGSFRDQLLGLLRDETVSRFDAVVAFATLDGVLMLGLEPGGALYDFLDRGCEVDIVVGRDLVTTDDALRSLRELAEKYPATFQLRVFSSQGRSLFHPKLYAFEKTDGSAVVLSGSNNLTAGGLSANTEYAVREELSATEYPARKSIFTQIASSPGAVSTVTDDVLVVVQDQRRSERKALRRALKTVAATALSQAASDGGLDKQVLVQMVPKSGDRLSQVGIRAQLMSAFFGLNPGQQRLVKLQKVQPGEFPGSVESRGLVRSNINRNSRIEVAAIRNIPYPAGGQRPILIFQEVGGDLYRYLLLMPGEDGHARVSAHLLSLPKQLALTGEIMTANELLVIWPNYPI